MIPTMIIVIDVVYTKRDDYRYTMYEFSDLSTLEYLSHLAAGRGEMVAVVSCPTHTTPCAAAWKSFDSRLGPYTS